MTVAAYYAQTSIAAHALSYLGVLSGCSIMSDGPDRATVIYYNIHMLLSLRVACRNRLCKRGHIWCRIEVKTLRANERT